MTDQNPNTRLEAFCDGVFAIAMTLLIIEIKPPSPESIHDGAGLWHALQHLLPATFAFVLSFLVILITWVNHHTTLRLVNKSSQAFMFANGFLLLTVVALPFPTALLGEFLFSPEPAAAVVLYNGILALQAVGWILITRVALAGKLTKDPGAAAMMSENHRNGYFAVALYSVLAFLALWIPIAVAVVTTLSWLFWLTLSLRKERLPKTTALEVEAA
jgi:uncharacterized membrane protein